MQVSLNGSDLILGLDSAGDNSSKPLTGVQNGFLGGSKVAADNASSAVLALGDANISRILLITEEVEQVNTMEIIAHRTVDLHVTHFSSLLVIFMLTPVTPKDFCQIHPYEFSRYGHISNILV